MLRPQYHLRNSERGLLASDVRRLIQLGKQVPVRFVKLSDIAELDENHWYGIGDGIPTCRSIVEHCTLIRDADLSYPIILDRSGRVMDGMHRVCKALIEGITTVPPIQFAVDPEPDYVGKSFDSLPYD